MPWIPVFNSIVDICKEVGVMCLTSKFTTCVSPPLSLTLGSWSMWGGGSGCMHYDDIHTLQPSDSRSPGSSSKSSGPGSCTVAWVGGIVGPRQASTAGDIFFRLSHVFDNTELIFVVERYWCFRFKSHFCWKSERAEYIFIVILRGYDGMLGALAHIQSVKGCELTIS